MAAQPPVTLEEFLSLDETKPYSEFANGGVYQKTGGDWSHSAVQTFLMVALFGFQQRTQLGEALPELLCIFGPAGRERAYVPDLVFVSQDKLSHDVYLRRAPDVAIEIVAFEEDVARTDNVQFYLLNGVRLVWVIDPEAKTIAVLTPGREGQTLSAGDTLDGGEVLPGFSVPVVDEIFAQVQV